METKEKKYVLCKFAKLLILISIIGFLICGICCWLLLSATGEFAAFLIASIRFVYIGLLAVTVLVSLGLLIGSVRRFWKACVVLGALVLGMHTVAFFFLEVHIAIRAAILAVPCVYVVGVVIATLHERVSRGQQPAGKDEEDVSD